IDVATGRFTPWPVAGGKAAFSAAAYLPDGKGVVYVSDEGSEYMQLRLRTPGKQAPRVLSAAIPWDVTLLAVDRNARHLAFVANEDGVSRLHVLDLPGLTPARLPALPTGVIDAIDFDASGERLAISLNRADAPADVYVVEPGSPELVRWTKSEVGDLDPERFVEPTLLRYPTFDTVDGKPRTIPAFYYRPRGDGPFPVVISIHGGPEAQALPYFNPRTQFLVNELGIAVLVPNVRGSAGYGKSYLLLDNGMKRKDSVKDIGSLLDWIERQPELDAKRVGVIGGSYGGYMVLASMVDYADRIAAGIDIVGISDFVTFLRATEEYRRDLRRAEYGDEREPAMRDFLTSIAPVRNAARITRPLFVAQGANDPRVPASEAEQIVAAVRGNGQDVWYLLFRDEGHGFQKKPNIDYFDAASMLFWQQHLLR
ncbi:MAG: S9 family peptidase, partial [Gammaproteobacteria bacterium]